MTTPLIIKTARKRTIK